MVIQQSMARIPSPYYHASASIQPANHSDFFNTHSPFHSLRPFGLKSPDFDNRLHTPQEKQFFAVVKWVDGGFRLISGMRFEIKLGNDLIGFSELEGDDLPMGVAGGRFVRTPAYKNRFTKPG